MVNAFQIRAEVKSFLANEDLDSFEDWIVQNTWNIHLSENAEAERLAYEIEAQLAEHSSERISFKELKRALEKIIVPTVLFAPSVVYAPAPIRFPDIAFIFDSRPTVTATQLARAIVR